MSLLPTNSDEIPEENPLIQAIVKAGGQTGYIFEGADGVGACCFVPVECVEHGTDSGLVVDEVAYFLSGWCLRNARLASSDVAASFIFPNPARLVSDIDSEEIRRFLERITTIHRLTE